MPRASRRLGSGARGSCAQGVSLSSGGISLLPLYVHVLPVLHLYYVLPDVLTLHLVATLHGPSLAGHVYGTALDWRAPRAARRRRAARHRARER